MTFNAGDYTLAIDAVVLRGMVLMIERNLTVFV
jgi:hypothetical protein